MKGSGYPKPITPVALPDDNLTKFKQEQLATTETRRSNTRLGFIHT
jgi:hypothetical protein